MFRHAFESLAAFTNSVASSFIQDTAMASEAHEYPGVNLPLRHLKQGGNHGVDFYRLGSFEGASLSQSELVQVREVAMMILMDRLTDKPNWHEKVFDDTIVAKWRNEALTQPEDDIHQEIIAGKNIKKPARTRIITEAAFDYVGLPLQLPSCHRRAQTDSKSSASPNSDARQFTSRTRAWSSPSTRPAPRNSSLQKPAEPVEDCITIPPSRPTRLWAMSSDKA